MHCQPLSRRFAIVALILALAAYGVAQAETGKPPPVADDNWPAGSVDVANAPSRVAYDEGPYGGLQTFLYHGDAATLTGLLARFARLDCPQRLLVIHPGTGRRPFASEQDRMRGTDWMAWSFSIWDPRRYYELYAGSLPNVGWDQPEFHTPLPPPRIDVWADSPGLDWRRVRIPAQVTVTDMRAASHGYKPDDGAVVTGVAYDLLTSKPIPGVAVSIARVPKQNFPDAQLRPDYVWKETADATGDAEGRFEVTKIPPGYSSIAVRAPGYAPRVISTAVIEAGSFQSLTVRLSRAEALSGSVVDTSGKPIAGVLVRLEATVALDGSGYPTLRQTEKEQATTDAAGQFTLADLPLGTAEVYITRKYYFLSDDFTETRVPAEKQPWVIVMAHTGSIHVTARDAASEPIAGIVCCTRPLGTGLWISQAPLDKQGTCTIDNLPPFAYTVSFDPFAKPGQAGAKLVEVKPGQTSTVELVGK